MGYYAVSVYPRVCGANEEDWRNRFLIISGVQVEFVAMFHDESIEVIHYCHHLPKEKKGPTGRTENHAMSTHLLESELWELRILNRRWIYHIFIARNSVGLDVVFCFSLFRVSSHLFNWFEPISLSTDCPLFYISAFLCLWLSHSLFLGLSRRVFVVHTLILFISLIAYCYTRSKIWMRPYSRYWLKHRHCFSFVAVCVLNLALIVCCMLCRTPLRTFVSVTHTNEWTHSRKLNTHINHIDLSCCIFNF